MLLPTAFDDQGDEFETQLQIDVPSFVVDMGHIMTDCMPDRVVQIKIVLLELNKRKPLKNTYEIVINPLNQTDPKPPPAATPANSNLLTAKIGKVSIYGLMQLIFSE